MIGKGGIDRRVRWKVFRLGGGAVNVAGNPVESGAVAQKLIDGPSI